MKEFEYNRKKIILFLIFSLILTFVFGWLFYDAKNQVFEGKPTYSTRYGPIFFKNEFIIRIFSSTLFCVMIIVNLRFFKLLRKKTMNFQIINNFLYQNSKPIINISEINSLKLTKRNKNYFIYIYVKNPTDLIEKETNLFKKLNYRITYYTEKTPICLNIDLLKNKPENTIKSLKQLIGK